MTRKWYKTTRGTKQIVILLVNCIPQNCISVISYHAEEKNLRVDVYVVKKYGNGANTYPNQEFNITEG